MTLLPPQEEGEWQEQQHYQQKKKHSHLQKFWCKLCHRRVVSPLYIYNKTYHHGTSTLVSCRDCYIASSSTNTKLREGREEKS